MNAAANGPGNSPQPEGSGRHPHDNNQCGFGISDTMRKIEEVYRLSSGYDAHKSHP